jgi:hypothetical protein
MTRQAGRVARMAERNCIRDLVGKRKGKRRLGGTKRRWEILLKCNLSKYVGRMLTTFTRIGIGSIVVLV